MSLRPKTRTTLLMCALALTLAAAIGADGTNEPTQVVTPVVRERTAAPQSTEAPAVDTLARLDLGRLAERYEDRRFPDLLGPRSWAPPPPPPPPPAVKPQPVAKPVELPPPPPVAPPLPFQYAGRLAGWNDKVLVYLVRGTETISVSPGETIGGTHRLESVSDTALTFVYLPLGQTQTLAIAQK